MVTVYFLLYFPWIIYKLFSFTVTHIDFFPKHQDVVLISWNMLVAFGFALGLGSSTFLCVSREYSWTSHFYCREQLLLVRHKTTQYYCLINPQQFSKLLFPKWLQIFPCSTSKLNWIEVNISWSIQLLPNCTIDERRSPRQKIRYQDWKNLLYKPRMS